jgi:hypothetical protein
VVTDQFIRPATKQSGRQRVGEDPRFVVHDQVRGPRRRGGQRRGTRLRRTIRLRAIVLCPVVLCAVLIRTILICTVLICAIALGPLSLSILHGAEPIARLENHNILMNFRQDESHYSSI